MKKTVHPFSFLIKSIKTEWGKNHKHKPISLPSDAKIVKILDIVYEASFKVEEGRSLIFNISFCPPKALKNDVKLRNRNYPIIFTTARSFNVHELAKLAPVADHRQVLIGINSSKRELVIWGLIDMGMSWWKFIRNEASEDLGGSPPPNCLIVSTKKPGEVTISRGDHDLCQLKEGKIAPLKQDVFNMGPFAGFIHKMEDIFYKDLLKKLKTNRFDEDGDDEFYPCRFFRGFLCRILERLQNENHGATILIVPDHWDHGTDEVKRNLSIKYKINDKKTSTLLIDKMSLNKHFYDHLFTCYDLERIPQRVFRCLQRIDAQRSDTDDLVNDRVNYISALANVDGAIVITTRLRLLGFGAEIITEDKYLKMFTLAKDARCKSTIKQSINTYGTRHRSALRFCATNKRVCAFVISQDGGVRAVLRLMKDVVLWPDIKI